MTTTCQHAGPARFLTRVARPPRQLGVTASAAVVAGVLASAALSTSPVGATAARRALDDAGPVPGTIFVADPGLVNGGDAVGPGSVTLYRPGASGHARPEVVVTKGMAGPGGIAVDSSGNLWVANESGDVVEYSRAELAKPSPVPTVTISPGGDGLAFDPSGNLWVSTGSSVVEFSKAELAKSGSPAPVATLSEDDCSLAFDSYGDLWEGSTSNTLSEWTKPQLPKLFKRGELPSPAVQITSNSLSGPCKPAFDHAGDVWAGNYNTELVVEFTKAKLAKTATLVPKVVISSAQNGNPGDVAFDASGNLWVPTQGLGTVVEYTKAQLAKSGAPVPHDTISMPTTSNGPWAVAIEP